MAGGRTELESGTDFTILISEHDGFNSNAAVSITIRSLILEASYGLLNSLIAAANLVIGVKDAILESLYHLLYSDEALSFIEEFHKFLGDLNSIPIALIGSHFQVSGVLPLLTRFDIILFPIVAAIVYRTAYMKIKLKPHEADPILRFICLVSGIISIELLFAIILSPFMLIKVHLYLILIRGGYCIICR